MNPQLPTPAIAFLDLHAQRTRLNGSIQTAIERVLDHGAFIMGPEVPQLEDALCDFTGSAGAIACSSGTDALILALIAKEVRPGDVVFLPSFTFSATAEAVALLGAIPWFVDVREDTFTMDPQSLAQSIDAAESSQVHVAGVIPVDLYGMPADYAEISALTEAAGIWVLADGAQSFGAELDGQRVGRLAPLTALSFFPSKPLGCYGDGGAVLDRDGTLTDTIKSLRVHGMGANKYDNVRIGLNARLDTIQAAILLQKLKILEEELGARQLVAKRFTAALSDLVRTPCAQRDATSAWAQYTIRVEPDARNRVAAQLLERGVPTAIYYPKPLHLQSAYRRSPCSPSGLKISEQLAHEVLSLPMHPYLDTTSQDHIIDALREVLK